MSIRQNIERFHLLFCRALLTAQDKSLIVLKGGCNLRFFMGSDRYSEDIDFDVAIVAKETLRKRVDKVLSGRALTTALAAAKIAITSCSSPKQTETVQRWKISLLANGLEIPSKIEFSRRGIAPEGTAFESVDPRILVEHRMTPTYMAHYTAEHALLQKIEALAGRVETQARDVYDIDLLYSRRRGSMPAIDTETCRQAIDRASSVDYDQFRGQVVEFLEGDARSYYGDPSSWNALQSRVVTCLKEMQLESD